MPTRLQFLQIIFGPQLDSLDVALQHPALQSDPEAIGLWMARIVAAIGSVSKAFKGQEELSSIFISVVEKVVQVLQALPTHDTVRAKV